LASYKTAFGSYIKAEDLQGKAVRVHVERVELETIKGNDGQSERKLVAHFAGKDKGLVLNRVNAESMATIFGNEDYDFWAGPIVLYPTTTQFGGKTVPCVRIKASTVPQMPPPVEPEPEAITDDDIGF